MSSRMQIHDDSTDSVPIALEERTAGAPLLVILTGQWQGRVVRLESELLIGRSPDAALSLTESSISRKHALLIRDETGGVRIRDLGSTNGTWVDDGQIVGLSEPLAYGDRIRIGSQTVIKYTEGDPVEEEFFSNLYEAATKDPLTGLYNRRAFWEQLDHEYAWHQRHQGHLTLMFVDLDQLKVINDSRGHGVGDQVLMQLSDIFRQELRTEDYIARFGGDEFAIILRHTCEDAGLKLARRLKEAVASFAFGPARKPVGATVSIGVCGGTGPTIPTPDVLAEEADRWAYVAKQHGRNRVACRLTDNKLPVA